jgi:hypothetical protein
MSPTPPPPVKASIRPVKIIHTKVARIPVDKSFEELARSGSVILWNLEGRWGLVTAPIVQNAFTAWRDHEKAKSIAPSTPAREFFVGWNQAQGILPAVVNALLRG